MTLPRVGADASRISTKLRRPRTRYVPTQLLAAGGMAEVWKGLAYTEGDDEPHPVALKRILPQLASQPLYRSMFEDEARLGMLLRHPNVVRVLDARDVSGTLLMVMELVDGTTLKSILDRAHTRGACMPAATALWITRELVRALEYAHAALGSDGSSLGIVHRDVSPHNLLTGRDGAVKLADFGLADASVHRTELAAGMVGGKLGYLAPELVEQRPSGAPLDVFCAGIVLWEMVCGRRLFQRASDAETVRAVAQCEVPKVTSINARAPREVDALLGAVLQRDAARRPSAAALARALDGLLARLDPHVGLRDVALIVGLHLAGQEAAPVRAQPPAKFLAELEALSGEEAAAPLDPSLFAPRRR